MTDKMTPKDLSQLYWLNKEIRTEQLRLAELEAAADPFAGITGLPKGAGLSDQSAAVQIDHVRRLLRDRLNRSVAEYRRLNQYIAGVDDSMMRQILTLRYIHGLSWVQVAHRIGGGNTEDSVRMAHNRYLRSHS
jgi:hypothetical protein